MFWKSWHWGLCFSDRGVPCNYRVRELVWCAGVAVYNCLLVVSVRLLVFCSHLFVVCGRLCSFAGGLWSFVMVCGGLLVVCGRLWWFAVVVCFRIIKNFFSFINFTFIIRKWKNKCPPIELVARTEISYFSTSS